MPDDIKTASVLPGILKQQLGEDRLKDDQASREFMSQDIWAKGATADFVATPETIEDMQTGVRAAHDKALP